MVEQVSVLAVGAEYDCFVNYFVPIKPDPLHLVNHFG